MRIGAHFFDEVREKIEALRQKIAPYSAEFPEVSIDVKPSRFDESFSSAREILANGKAAKLVLIDQYGVDYVSDERFRELISFPTCDTLFFISSSTLHRFRDHPAIKQRIQRPDDYYHVHRAVADYYRTLLPRRRVIS
jgi:three-Cys-motif partner protein